MLGLPKLKWFGGAGSAKPFEVKLAPATLSAIGPANPAVLRSFSTVMLDAAAVEPGTRPTLIMPFANPPTLSLSAPGAGDLRVLGAYHFVPTGSKGLTSTLRYEPLTPEAKAVLNALGLEGTDGQYGLTIGHDGALPHASGSAKLGASELFKRIAANSSEAAGQALVKEHRAALARLVRETPVGAKPRDAYVDDAPIPSPSGVDLALLTLPDVVTRPTRPHPAAEHAPLNDELRAPAALEPEAPAAAAAEPTESATQTDTPSFDS